MVMSLVLSVIIPVYNVEKYIARCLDSLYDQDLDESNYELIIVNDGSLDQSMIIVESYAKNHQNIRIVNKENGGVSSARNIGIQQANGQYLLFVDSDDAVEKNGLKTVHSQLMKEHVEVLILNSFEIKNNTPDKVEVYLFPQNLSDKIISGVELFQNGYLGKGSVWGATFEKQFLLQHQIAFSESIINGEDTLFMALSFVYATKVKHVNIDFYHLHQRIGSASQSWNYNRIRVMYNNFIPMKIYIEKNSLTIDQMEILNYHIYITISNIINNFFSVHRLNKYVELKQAIVESGFYPIEINKLNQLKYKINLLNFSFDLYCLLIFFRQLLKDILKNNS